MGDALRGGWIIIVVFGVLVAAIAWISSGGGTTYTSTAAVLLRPIPGNALSPDIGSSSQQTTVALETEAELVNSPRVLELLNDRLSTDITPGDHSVEATVATNTQILNIAFTGATAGDARRGARGAAESFLAYRADQAVTVQQRQVERLEEQLKTAQQQLTEANERNQKKPTSGTATQVQLYAGRVAALQESIGSIQATDTEPGTLIAPASRAKKSSAPRLLITLGGLFVGLAIGIAIAFWRRRRDRHLHPRLGEHILGVPILGHLSARTSIHDGPQDEETAARLREEYRYLRTALIPTLHPTPTTLVIASLDAAGSNSLIASDLARYMSVAGFKVTLVDGDLTAPDETVHHLFGIDATPGLAEFLLDPESETVTVHRTGALNVVASGESSEAARERLVGAGFAKVIEQLSPSADLLIVSAPPVTRAETLAMAMRGARLLLIVKDGIDDVDALQLALEGAHRLDVDIVGLVSVAHDSHTSRIAPKSEAATQDQEAASTSVATVKGSRPGDGG